MQFIRSLSEMIPHPASIFTRYSTSMLDMKGFTDWMTQTSLVTVMYIATYVVTAGIFEWTNPAPKTEKRLHNMKKELYYGISAMVCNVCYAVTWLYAVDKFTPYYGYYAHHPYGLPDFAFNAISYMFFMDTWFYWTHRLLHHRFFWIYVHFHHHQFINPTAFAQDAVHPFEAVLQGPMGHHMVTLLVPMHPVSHALFGFLTSVYAIAAHDGRQFDLNDHVKHHHYTSCNFGLYWGLWDYICGTRYSSKKYQFMNSDSYVNPPLLSSVAPATAQSQSEVSSSSTSA